MGLSAHGHRSQHPGTAPARCLHSHRANHGTATVGPTPLQETQLCGWEPDHLGRVRVPVWLNLPVATILTGLTRLIVISSWIAAGPTRANTFQIGRKESQADKGRPFLTYCIEKQVPCSRAERISPHMYRVHYLEQTDKMSQQVHLHMLED